MSVSRILMSDLVAKVSTRVVRADKSDLTSDTSPCILSRASTILAFVGLCLALATERAVAGFDRFLGAGLLMFQWWMDTFAPVK